MKYKLEFFPNPNCISIHISKRLISTTILAFDSPLSKESLYEDNKYVGEREQPAFVKRLFEIEGITRVSLSPYEVHLTKGELFEWDQKMLERIIAILNIELFPDSEAEQVGEPKRPTPEMLRHLRKMGCDIDGPLD